MVVVVVPVKESVREQARALLAKGPPFDPAESGLDAHHVYVTEREAIFLFEAADRAALEGLSSPVDAWAPAEGWRVYLAGEPRVAEEAYSWTRSPVPEGVSFEATPGPGDSEGGDVYPP
jgi:hypothetical protein